MLTNKKGFSDVEHLWRKVSLFQGFWIIMRTLSVGVAVVGVGVRYGDSGYLTNLYTARSVF